MFLKENGPGLCVMIKLIFLIYGYGFSQELLYTYTNINISRYELGPIGQWTKLKIDALRPFIVMSTWWYWMVIISSNLIPLRAVNENPVRNTGERAWFSSYCSVLTPPHISTSAPWQILLNLLGSKSVSLVKDQIRVGATAQLEWIPSMYEALISIPNTLKKNQITQRPLLKTCLEALTTAFWTWTHRQVRMTRYWDALAGESNRCLPYDHPGPGVTLW